MKRFHKTLLAAGFGAAAVAVSGQALAADATPAVPLAPATDGSSVAGGAPAASGPRMAGGPCVVLFGGGGNVTQDAGLNARWFAINSVVSKDTESSLAGMGYRVEDYVLDLQDSDQRMAALIKRLDETKCSKVVQISNLLKGERGSKFVTSFVFSVSVFHLTGPRSAGPAAVKVVGEYQKDYEYPLTKETMQNLSMADVGAKIATDVDAAKVLGRR